MVDPTPSGEKIVGPTQADDDVLRVEHVTKRFGPITALRDINLHLRKGEVLGLLGDNGAGKSTLIKILCGFHKPDAGTMWLKGEPYAPKSVLDARQHGIDTVYQDLALVDQLSVYQNMFLFREKVKKPIPFLSNHIMKQETREALSETGINIPRIDVPVARLSGGQRQAIAVARTISGDADVMLLDEPLAAMGAKEGALILDLIAGLKAEGRVSSIMLVLEDAIPYVIAEAGIDPADVTGLGIDFTSCTVLPVDSEGIPLCKYPHWRRRPHAWPKLWKHHAAQPVADRLTEVALERQEDFLSRYGGRISSEWYFPKLIELWLEDREVYNEAHAFVEATDWVIWHLTGRQCRQTCTAGYKAMWSPETGLPPTAYFEAAYPG